MLNRFFFRTFSRATVIHLASLLVAWSVLPRVSHAVAPSPAEMNRARRWSEAKFLGVAPAVEPGLHVVRNHGPVQVNSRAGESIRIGGKSYERGLYCHANSAIVVRLPRPGKLFTSEIGVDPRANGGSIVFSVGLGGRDVFVSEVMRLQSPAQPASVELKGATEFSLNIADGGDGIDSDQGNWADAKVVLDDGSELWLGDLPMRTAGSPSITTAPPFSFMYGGQPSSELVAKWKVERATVETPVSREHTLTFIDPATKLIVRCVGVEWLDSPTIEWVVYFKNGGASDTPLIQDIRAIDTMFAGESAGEGLLRYNTGDRYSADSYQPHAEPMPVGHVKAIASTGGRPTQDTFPYFNLGWQKDGVIVALGWPGQWSAEFSRAHAGDASAASANNGSAVRVRGGQELTRFKLHPGEEVRGPRVVLQFYHGDWIRGQNLWRSWMVNHNMPRPGGQLAPALASLCTGNYYGASLKSNAEQELAFLKQHLDAGIDFDAWWQDAGWYPCGDMWSKTGTWEVDRTRFPKGIREVSDFVHAKGKKSILWFEPERVVAGTWIAENHPEWVHGGKDGGLLKLSDPACRRWLTDHIDKLITEQGIDIYRQDFNINPLPYWRAADAEDRQGITEIRHVEGYLAYWDELMRRHPNMLIDSCASGGRRNDLETMRRAVPFLRSDWYFTPEGQQCHTYGLSLWLPYQGTAFLYPTNDKYWARSSMVAQYIFGPLAEGMEKQDMNLVKEMVAEQREIRDCFFGDFYPLTPYSLADDVWMAWQYDLPESGKGVVQVFRRGESNYEAARFPLRGLEPEADYAITNLDTRSTVNIRGRVLLEEGLPIAMPDRKSSAVFTYRRGMGVSPKRN